MPKGVDERLWTKAKEAAAKQGRAGDYAYIMGIYKKMSKSLTKSFIIPADRLKRIPGQVPSKDNIEIMRLAETPPKKFRPAMLLEQTGNITTPQKVVDGLGLDRGIEKIWAKFLEDAVQTPDEKVLRKALYSRFQEEKLDPALRSVIFQRALIYHRGLQKSMIQIFTPDDLIKAQSRGGTYVRRVQTSKGRYRYYYDEDKYHRSKDAHPSGETVSKQHITEALTSKIQTNGKKGVKLTELKDLVKKHGSKLVASVLKESNGNSVQFKKGTFYGNDDESNKGKENKKKNNEKDNVRFVSTKNKMAKKPKGTEKENNGKH